MTSGVLEPRRIVGQIVRELPRPDIEQLMHDFAAAEPVAFIRNLARARRNTRGSSRQAPAGGADRAGRMGAARARGDAAPRRDGRGRDRPAQPPDRHGLHAARATATYDGAMQRAVQAFQIAHGLEPDGIAGPKTLAAVNVEPEERLRAIIVALERERWLNIERGERHIWVNLTDFHARIVDHDRVTLETRAVIGARQSDMQTPEFSHRMTYLELNPTGPCRARSSRAATGTGWCAAGIATCR
jgi:L,D-transpeptidase YcbB